MISHIPSSWNTQQIHPSCSLGQSLPPLTSHRGSCDPITNLLTETRVETRQVGCECKRHVTQHRCHCNCPNEKLITVCQQRLGLFHRVKVTHQLDENKCLCKAHRLKQTTRIECPNDVVVVREGPCQEHLRHDGARPSTEDADDKYRLVIRAINRLDSCQCQRREITTKEACCEWIKHECCCYASFA